MIRQIDDENFFDLAELYHKYNQCLATKYNKSSSTQLLSNELRVEGSLALGLFKDNKLVGFTLGKPYNNELYTFTAMYILPRYRYYMKHLFEASEQRAKEYSYTGFISESSTKEGINMHYKMGCSPIEIKFYKEL